jgi:hypothetical protein
MPATRVQSNTGDAGSYVTSFNITFPGSVTAGNMIYFSIYFSAGLTVNSVSDNLSNTYNLIDTGTGPYGAGAHYYAYNIKGGSVTITVTLSDSAFAVWVAREYSGLTTTDPLDKKAEALDGSFITSHTTGTTATTTQDAELVIATYVADYAAEADITITGFSNLIDDDNGTYGGVAMADKDQSVAAAQSASITTGGVANCWGAIATFKEAVAAATFMTKIRFIS